MKKVIAILLLLVPLAGCGSNSQKDNDERADPGWLTGSQSAENRGSPKTDLPALLSGKRVKVKLDVPHRFLGEVAWGDFHANGTAYLGNAKRGQFPDKLQWRVAGKKVIVGDSPNAESGYEFIELATPVLSVGSSVILFGSDDPTESQGFKGTIASLDPIPSTPAPAEQTIQNQDQPSKGQPRNETEQKAVAALKNIDKYLRIVLDQSGNVEVLDLVGDKLTDDDLVQITQLKHLQQLDLTLNTRITDAGLLQLSQLTTLKHLRLFDIEFTDAGLEHLKGLSRLEGLYFSSHSVTDAGFRHLRTLTRLRRLHLYGVPITDAGLEHLKPLAQLDTLDLRATGVTSTGLSHLTGLVNLQRLLLTNTKIDDSALIHLQKLKKLNDLRLPKQITDAGVAELQKAFPNCKIKR